MKNQKGFSLVELLVVVIIIAIIAAIAIPNLLSSRRAANEASAINTLRSVHSAQVTYQATTGGTTSFADGSGLTGLLDATLAADTFNKSGYAFAINADGTGNVNYCATGTPASTSTGSRIFGVGNTGVINAAATADPPVAIACANGVVTAGAPIGN